MKKSKLLLPIYLIVSLVIIIAAVIVSLTAGINLGIDFAGGKQIEIKLDETTNTSGYPEKINAALKDYNLVIDSSFQEDKYTDTYYVVKINHQKAMTDETKNDIRSAIANKLGINTENVGEVVEISGNITEQTLINISIAIVAIFVLVFVACWIRYGVMNGLASLFNSLLTMILSFALVLITRLELNIPTCIGILITSVLSLAMFTVVLEKVRELSLSKQNKDMTNEEIYNVSTKKTISSTIIVGIMLIVFGIACFFSPVTHIQLFSIAIFECLIVAVFSYMFVSSKLGAYLADIKSIRDKQKLSKNEPLKNKKRK